MPSWIGRTGAWWRFLRLARVPTDREGRAAQKRAEFAVPFDQPSSATFWADLDGDVAIPSDDHVGVIEEFDYEWGHPLRVADKQNGSACPGQGHVEKTAFLGTREGFRRGHGQVEHGVVGDCAGNPYVPVLRPGITM